jgi:glycosyltransferase involved in cell wall biosynthesis
MKAKIVHLIGQTSRGGAERQLAYLARSLHDRDWPQTVVSFDAGGPWRNRWKEMGIPTVEIPRTRFKPWRLWQLSQLFRREKPAIIHVWSLHLVKYARWAWGKPGASIVLGLRQDPTATLDTGDSLPQARYKRAMQTAHCIVSNSQHAIDNLQQRGVRLPSHQVVGNIVISRGDANAGEPAAVPRIVSVGSLRPSKAYDVLLHAAARLAAQNKPFEILIVGDGPQRPQLQELSTRLNLTDRVRFLGERDDIPQLLAGAHILAHPSKSEGLSNTILEGMAAGLPVVGTWEAASEILCDGHTGLLVPASQAPPLADAIGRLLDDPALRDQLGKAALQFIRQYCNTELIVQQYEKVYYSLLNSGTA